MDVKFFKCNHCGQIITKIKDVNVPVSCCGEKMQELVAGAVDAAVEKHVPVVEVKGNDVLVSVGSVTHPMTEEHFIEWIALVTNKGVKINNLTPKDEPKTSFCLADGEKVECAYAYCNLHGLWKK